MNNNIHTYLQHLSLAVPSRPMVLIQGQAQLSDDDKSFLDKIFSHSEKDPAVVLKVLNRYLERNIERLDESDFPALRSIYNYFQRSRVAEEAQSEKSWLLNLCRSFETLHTSLSAESQPALASGVPIHIRSGYRVRIAEQTKLISEHLKDLEQPMLKNTIIEGGETDASLKELLSKAQQHQITCKKFDTKISVINSDCLEVAMGFRDKVNVTLLNMANANGPGGGWLIGDSAQEEELFRRTNYHRALTPELNPVLNNQLSNRPYHIPFFGAIFTPEVTVLRDRENQVLAPGQRFQVNMIASAALDLRPYSGNEELKRCGGEKLDSGIVKNYTKQKIQAQLAVSLLQGSKILILGAFGCGAFCNDPLLVSQCYKEVLEEPLFKHAFREVIFAIIDPHKTNNFTAFADRFTQ